MATVMEKGGCYVEYGGGGAVFVDTDKHVWFDVTAHRPLHDHDEACIVEIKGSARYYLRSDHYRGWFADPKDQAFVDQVVKDSVEFVFGKAD